MSYHLAGLFRYKQYFGRRGAAIAQWIRLRLPSCRPGFESQAHHLCFFNLYLSFELECEKNENQQKEAMIGPFLKKNNISVKVDTFLKAVFN